jgi:hypothetical protein
MAAKDTSSKSSRNTSGVKTTTKTVTPKKNGQAEVVQSGDIEIEQLELDDLQPLRVLVQALDNQWIPRALLPSVMKAGQITGRRDRRLRKAVRAEYIRSLINGEQVIINRAYVYNNPAISQDYSRRGAQREAFRELLKQQAIVPYLMGEQTPIDAPQSGAGTQSAYNTMKSFEQWQQVCQEVRVPCVRLSWNDRENWQLSRQLLSKRFNEFVLHASAGDIDQYVQDLGLDSSARSGLGKRLVELGQFCLDLKSKDPDRQVTRNEIYKAFVSEGDNPVERKYDKAKPFAGEIKQLLDLAYNCNLPDALKGYLITPVDSLPRTALQEWQQVGKQASVTGEELLTLLKRTAFDLVQRGLNLKAMDRLSLQEVREIRGMDEWREYIQSMKDLLDDPLHFADGGAANVYASYNKLAARITDLVAKQPGLQDALGSWMPAVELLFYVAGAVLSCTWTPEGSIYQLFGQLSGLVGGASAPIVGRLVIRDMAEKKAEQDLSTSIDFMRGRLLDARNQWRELMRQVRKLPGFQEVAGPQEEQEIVDPIMSYQIDY